ncbi:MAG: hypothetical protein AB7F35_21185 [Acetobacteraceae bacterium]
MPVGPEDFRFLKEMHGRLGIDEPLHPGSPYYEPLHESDIQDNPVAQLRTTIEFATVESMQLFSGFRGSGKTTELLRLKQQLEEAGYVVAYASAMDFLNPAEPLDIGELLVVLAAAFGEAVEDIPGAAIPVNPFWDRLVNFLTNTTVTRTEIGGSAGFETPLSAVLGKLQSKVDLKLELKTPSSFRQNLQRVLNAHLPTLRQNVSDYCAEVVKRIRLERGADTNVVFLFDQLEQMRGGLLTEQEVIRSIERVFTTHLDYLRIPFLHLVYTVPPWLKFMTPGMMTPMVLLPTRHLWENDADRSPTRSNQALFHAVVRRRMGDDGLARLFGAEPAERERLVDRLIDACGGHLRDLLRLLQETVVRARAADALPIGEPVVTAAINAVRRSFLPIAQADAKWLAEIARNRATALPDTDPAAINRLGRFLDSHAVLYFVNADEWYDIHPLIRDEVEKMIVAGAADG